MARIFSDEEQTALDPRAAAILTFAAKLSRCPSAAAPSDTQALRDAGLTLEEIFDLILSVALFGWANRLMHTLGEPVEKGENSSP